MLKWVNNFLKEVHASLTFEGLTVEKVVEVGLEGARAEKVLEIILAVAYETGNNLKSEYQIDR